MLVLERNDGDVGPVGLLAGELDGTVHQCVESVVFAHTDVLVGIVDSTPLTDNDVAGFNDLAAELLEAETLAMGLAAVLGTGLTFLVCHNVSFLSDFVNLDLGELLAMTIELLEALATDLLEDNHLVCPCGVVQDGGLHHCTLDVGSADLDGLSVSDEKHLAELDGVAVVLGKTVDENFISSLNFELLACNVYDCVHKKQLFKVSAASVCVQAALYQWLNGYQIFLGLQN